MADPWNDAWAEAEATAPPHVLVYYTLEFQHATFDEPARVIAGVDEDLDFGIEQGASQNGGETVTFKACEFFAERPELSEGKAPECQIVVDNVARLLVPQLDAAVAVKADLIAIYREYRSDDLSEPCYGPVTFTMRKVAMTGTRLTGVAKIDDLANRKFPSRVYTMRDFPGLQV